MIGTSLFTGVVDFTKGNVSQFIGATGTAVYNTATITLVDPAISAGLTAGMPVTTKPYGIIPDGTTILSVSGSTIELANPVGYTGDAGFYFGLTAGSYYLSNAKLIDINQLVTVDDIPDYEIGLSGGLGIKPFAVYAQALQTSNRVLKAIYLKYIVTKVLSRNLTSSTFNAIISWGGSGTELGSGTKLNPGIRVLPLVELSSAGLLPPIIDFRAYEYSRLPEGQPFNADIIDTLGGLGIKDVYSQYEQIVGGTTGIPYATSFNFVDGPEDQVEYIDAYIDPTSPPGVGNVIVSVKTPGFQASTITYTPTRLVGEKVGNTSVQLIRTLSGESDKLVPSLVRISYTFENVTAINGVDYIGTPGFASFLATSGSSFSVPFEIINLSGIQPDRVFNINYTVNSSSTGKAIFKSSVSGATGATASSVITIYDQDNVSSSGFNFSRASDTVYEPKLGNAGSTGDATNFYKIPAVFSKTQTGTLDPLQGQVRINLLELQSTAVRGSDYEIYYNGTVNGATSWLVNYSSYGTDYGAPIYIVPLRNPSSYDTASLVRFDLTGATASGQAGVTFPASVTTPNTYTFNIKNADITTVSTFTFTQSSFDGIPEGQTGDVVLQRSVTTFGGYSQNDSNVNYWQPTNTTVDLQIKNTSTADLGVDYQNLIDFYTQQTGGSPVQTINFITTNPATITFPASGNNPLANPVFTERRWMRIRTINNGVPEPPGTDRTIYLGLTGATGTIGGVQKAQLGTPKDTNIYITDPSQWASSVFSVTVDNASPAEPRQGDPQRFVTFTISRNLSAGSVPGLIDVLYRIEAITAGEGTDYQVVGPAEGNVAFTAGGNNTFAIQAEILPQGSPAPQEPNKSFKITLISATYTNPSTTGLATISTSQKTATVTIQDTFDELDYNRGVLLIHGGFAQYPQVPDLTAVNAVYTLPTGGAPNYPSTYTTTDLSEVMYKMQTIGPPYFPVITTVTLPKNKTIPDLKVLGTQTLPWPATAFPSPEKYYFAIPTNEEDPSRSPLYYPENLAAQSPTYVKNASSLPTRAINASGQGKQFTLGGKGYKLYITGDNASLNAQTYTFG
jgi:hypothetical protein